MIIDELKIEVFWMQGEEKTAMWWGDDKGSQLAGLEVFLLQILENIRGPAFLGETTMQEYDSMQGMCRERSENRLKQPLRGLILSYFITKAISRDISHIHKRFMHYQIQITSMFAVAAGSRTPGSSFSSFWETIQDWTSQAKTCSTKNDWIFLTRNC